MPEQIRITDVSPRDGLQNEPGVIATAEKVRLVELLCATGVDEIEVSSFVSPKWVPQLGDAAEVFSRINALDLKAAGTGFARLSALVPNDKGLQAALDVNRAAGHALISKLSVFTAASDTFSKKNTNATIAETIERFKPVIAAAREHDLEVRGYVSCVIACPFEGPIAPAQVAQVVEQLIGIGADEIDLGDTIGAGDAASMRAMLNDAIAAAGGHDFNDFDEPNITLHLHDTFARASECVRAALDLGVISFDGSVAGLGGCPYASIPGKRAPGNISTDLLVRTIHDSGFTTGVDLGRLAEAAAYAREIVDRARAAAASTNAGGGA